MHEDIYWIWLSRLNLNAKEKLELVLKYKSPEIIFNERYSIIKKITKEEIDLIKLEELIEEEKRINKYKIKLINLYSNYYSSNLRYIYDAPILLYALGNIELLNSSSVAIVGSRKCSVYGKLIAEKISGELARSNISIISGLAKGIDTSAHIGAKGKTIAVLGSGLDVIYPKENIKLAKEIVSRGGLIISEYGLGTKPEKMHFPSRNRIISGIANKVIVVEAGERSGSLITAEFALEQGKDVYAVPGNITSKQSVGTNNLIKEGAMPYTTIRDLL